MGFHEWLSHDNFFELNPYFSRNGGPPELFKGESSEILIEETIQFIDRSAKANKPFLAVIWFGSPHEPYSGLPDDLALYDDLPSKYTKSVKLTSNETGKSVTRPQGEVLRERYAEITAMDRSIGRLRASLQRKGLRENTLLFYCGDNGTSPDAALGSPHRGHKGQIYDGGTLVPGLIEWPAKISRPRTTDIRASTSDLLPTLCALVNAPLPNRPIDGIDLSPLIFGSSKNRDQPLCFWEYDSKNLSQSKREPWIAPHLQEGTTPLAKLSGGKATRDFTNYRHPIITEADYFGSRSIIDGHYKLIVQTAKNGNTNIELFNLDTDPAEANDLSQQSPEIVSTLHAKLKQWQKSVLNSLTGADYLN